MRRAPRAVPALSAFALSAAVFAGAAGPALAAAAGPAAAAAVPAPAIGPGSLVCPARSPEPADGNASATRPPAAGIAGAGSAAADSLPDLCPLLVVSVDSARGTLRAVSAGPSDYRLPRSRWVSVGRAALPGRLLGATDSALEKMVPGANPGTLTLQRAFGLLVASSAGGVDTLTPEAWPPLLGPRRPVPSLAALIDSLRASPYYGKLAGPLAPPWACSLAAVAAWSPDTGTRQARWRKRGGQALSGVLDPGVVFLPAPGLPARRRWVFLQGGDSLWVWRDPAGGLTVLRPPFLQNAAPDRAEALDLDRDGRAELLVHVTTHYGDGFYRTLHVLAAARGAAPPRVASLEVSGSSGEPGGSTVESEGWMKPPFYLTAGIEAANDSGSGDSHDLRFEAHRYAGKAGFRGEKGAAFRLVLFGAPEALDRAHARAARFSRAVPAARADVRVVPRLIGGRRAWQAAVLAPDAARARAWAARDSAGAVLGPPPATAE